MDVSILGAGAMGSALTIPFSDNHHSVKLWGSQFDEDILADLRSGEPHPRISVGLPSSVDLLGPGGLDEALTDVDLVVLAVSSGGVVPMGQRLAGRLPDDVPLVTIAKGIVEYENEPYLVEEGLRTVLESEGPSTSPVACLGGPSIAMELAERSRTSVGVASESLDVAENVKGYLSTEYFSLDATDDIRGLETCIGYKNIYSIALAWPTGISDRDGKNAPSSMKNLKALLFLRTLEEMKTLVDSFGGRSETVMGLPGLGDLVTTSAGGRNGSFGRMLGQGKTVDEALDELKSQGVGVIEGYETASLGKQLAEEASVNVDKLPLLRETNRVLYEDKSVDDALDEINF